MGSGDDKKKGSLRDRLAGLSVGDAAELLVVARQRIREAPVEHAKAAADVTRALADARRVLPATSFQVMRRAVLLVARRDWAAAAILAEALGDLVRDHPDSVDWVGEAVARTVQADRRLARQLARVLPECAAAVPDRGPRLRIVTALADLCRRHPGLGLAALPTVRNLLAEGSADGLASFLEEALGKAAQSESVARSFLLRESRAGQEAWDSQREGLALASIARTLQLYAEAHLGTGVRVRPATELPAGVELSDGAIAVTDGRHIFLAPRLDRFEDDLLNFRLYKVSLAHEVGRIEFGTFELMADAVPGLDPIEVHPEEEDPTEPGPANPVLVFASRFPDPALARRLLLFAEDLRVDACLRREYPGLARDMEAMSDADRRARPDVDALQGPDLVLELLARWLWFGEPLPEGPAWKRFHEASWLLQALRHPSATVQDSAGSTVILYRLVGGDGSPADIPPPPSPDPKMGFAISPAGAGGAEGEVDGDGSGEGMAGSMVEMGAGEDFGPPSAPGGRLFTGDVVDDVDEAERRALLARARAIQQALDARGVAVSLREIRAALEVDVDVPDSTVERNLLEGYRESLRRGASPSSNSAQGPEEEPSLTVARYPEWDEQIGDYRPRWCSVWERRATGDANSFVEGVMSEHGPMVRRLRREFEMLRPTGLGRERKAREGEELDVEALVEELVDMKAGRPSDGRVYLRRHRKLRDVSVAFLVDLSASTRELVGDTGKSVIDVEKESLVMMSEALEALGDRYAIFGFSGRGRQMVTFDVFKDFGERLSEPVRGRIGAMSYKMENRDGAAIRHATQRLLAVEGRTRLLILLSDGKPLDCGCDLYQASYAQADTRMALREAMEQKVHPFCITVDPQGEDYLREMYGDVRYAVIDSVEALPARLPAIYRRLTT